MFLLDHNSATCRKSRTWQRRATTAERSDDTDAHQHIHKLTAGFIIAFT